MRRMFDKKTHHGESESRKSAHRKKKRPTLHYDSDDSDRQKRLLDASRRNTKKLIARTVDNPEKLENLHHAVELRMTKQKHTDFYFKLHELKERIEVYNEIFLSRVPKYMKKSTKVIHFALIASSIWRKRRGRKRRRRC